MVAMLEWWKDNRDHFEAEIGKWIAYVPENVRNTFKDWNWMTSIKGRCLQLCAKYEKFYQLCETNPGLAFALADRKNWDKSHPLSKKRINEVLEEKQSELSVLLGFGSGGWKILRKLSPELLMPAYIRLFRELVKDPFYLGVFNNSNQIHETGFDFIMKAMTSKYKNLLSASLLLDIFRNYDSRDRENWDIELLFMIDGMNYEYGKESYGTNLFYFWEDCIDYNQERGITTVKSLLRRHDQMVTELNELDEEKVLKENKSLPHLPEIVREITTVGNKHGYKRVKIEQITTSYDLFQAGKRLKNCAFSYLDDGLNGDYYFFSIILDDEEYLLSIRLIHIPNDEAEDWEENFVRDDENAIYTCPIPNGKNSSELNLDQFSGHSNSKPPERAWAVIKEWFDCFRKKKMKSSNKRSGKKSYE